MKKVTTLILLLFAFLGTEAQVQHLFEHTFPQITTPNQDIQLMVNELDVDNIKNNVNDLCSFLNRRADGPYIYDVEDWLIGKYRSFGLDSIWLHEFEPASCWDTVPKPFQTAPNVLAVQQGTTKPHEIIICGGHYDSTIKDCPVNVGVDTLCSPGADDNASGVAGIIETARILSKYSFERTIIYACWNAEEFGLCGSHAFARDCASDSVDIVAYTNLDMTGYLKPGDNIHIHLLYVDRDSLLGNFMKQIVNAYYPEINVCRAWLTSGGTDYSSFNRNGYQGVSLSEDVHNMSPYIHTINDIVGLSINNYDNSMVFTGVTIAAVAELAGMQSSGVEENNSAEFSVYPNPASEKLQIEGDFAYFEIFDMTGKMIHLSKNDREIDVSNWKSGMYLIRIFDNNGKVFTNKFFVKPY